MPPLGHENERLANIKLLRCGYHPFLPFPVKWSTTSGLCTEDTNLLEILRSMALTAVLKHTADENQEAVVA